MVLPNVSLVSMNLGYTTKVKSIWRILVFTKTLKKYYIIVSIFAVLVAATSQVIPLLTKAAVDEIQNHAKDLPSVNIQWIILLAVFVFLADVLSTLFNNFGGYFGDILAAKQRALLGSKYYEHILKLPQKYFDRELTGTIINRMDRGVNQITSYTQTLSNNFLQFIFSTIFTLVIVAHYSWPVAILLFSLFPIYILLTAKSSGKWLVWQKDINADLDLASGRFAEGVGQIKVVKSFVHEALELNFFNRLLGKVIKTTAPQSRYWHRNDIFRRSVLAIINFALYAFIFLQAAHGQYSIGTMVALIQFVQLARLPLFSISFLVDQTQRAIGNSQDYFAVIDEPVERPDNRGAKLVIKQPRIEFDDVSFGYNDTTVLKHISFTAEPNSKVALVGQSGEGKTTITSLLLGMYEPDKGRILIDGQSTADVSQTSLRHNVAVVFQEPALFSGTVTENIAYGNPQASKEAIIKAAKAANADEFISKFDKAYDTEIGERGLRLSGGQKQRIAIARAVLKDAPILVLDEATSSLDSRSEQLVQEALERLMQGRTTLIIAHRLSTIRSVDQIVTIKGGKVDETGSPTELAQTGGVYAELLALQATLAGDDREKRFKAYGLADS